MAAPDSRAWLPADVVMCDGLLIDDGLADPKWLGQAVEGMTASQMDASPELGRRSTRQVICHLANFEPVYVIRM